MRWHGFADEAILEAVLTAAFTDFVCTLSDGPAPVPDFLPKRPSSRAPALRRDAGGGATGAHDSPGPYLRAVDLGPDAFPPFAFFRERFGFIPNIFRAQTLRPDVVEAEAEVLRSVLLPGDILTRVQKEYILLVVSAANLNTYCVAVHCELLRGLGISEDASDQIALNHREAGLSKADTALLDFALKLSRRPGAIGQADIDRLRRHGFTDAQILEAVVMTALTSYLNTLQTGLGTVPDFGPRRDFGVERGVAAALDAATGPDDGEDPDAPLVARVQGGDVAASEELVRRHQGRIYRTLIGLTGNAADAEDGTQDAFLKAFEQIGKFRGASKFAMWLTRIAINEGIQRLRGRKRRGRLDDDWAREERALLPRRVRAWDASPERLYSQAEMRRLVERALLRLPTMYRVAVILRDIEQLSTEEAAKALSVGVAALKSRLLRGRLMLREALAPHFISREKGTARV